MPSYDVVIAGAGIAGACAALALSRDCEVLVVEADEPAAGASGAAAGLVNPLMGRKAKAVWRIEQALTGFMHTLADAGAEALFHDTGVLRPTVEEKQVQFFQDALARHGDYAEWLPDAAVRERFPAVQTCGGALWIPRGGAIDVTAFVRAVLAAAQKQGATRCRPGRGSRTGRKKRKACALRSKPLRGPVALLRGGWCSPSGTGTRRIRPSRRSDCMG